MNKTKSLIVILILFYCGAVQAQQRAQPLTKEQYRARRIAVAAQHPFRIHDGKLYDLTEVIYSHAEAYCVEGDVMRVGTNYVIVHRPEFRYEPRSNAGQFSSLPILYKPEATYCLKDYPEQSSAVDGKPINCVAFQVGRFQYQTPTGAIKTVPLYEYGKPLAGSGQSFTVMTKIYGNGSQAQVPFEP